MEAEVRPRIVCTEYCPLCLRGSREGLRVMRRANWWERRCQREAAALTIIPSARTEAQRG